MRDIIINIRTRTKSYFMWHPVASQSLEWSLHYRYIQINSGDFFCLKIMCRCVLNDDPHSFCTHLATHRESCDVVIRICLCSNGVVVSSHLILWNYQRDIFVPMSYSLNVTIWLSSLKLQLGPVKATGNSFQQFSSESLCCSVGGSKIDTTISLQKIW